MSLAAHGTVERYAQGCGCSACVIADAKGDEARRLARVRHIGRNANEPIRRYPVPATFARCVRACGRLVWHFDTGLCGQCGRSQQAAA